MKILKWIGGMTGVAVLAGLFFGVVIGIPVVDQVDQYFSSNAFCADACHSMKDTVAKEFDDSTHGTTSTGVVPQCRDCHLPDRLPFAMVKHVYGLRDLYAHVVKGIDTPEEFETVRFFGANRVRMELYESDSRNCRGCHVMEKIKPAKKRGQRQHAEAIDRKITCIVCHYDLVHKEVPLSEEFDAIVGSY
jgi:cytochrome c-type protein NapC